MMESSLRGSFFDWQDGKANEECPIKQSGWSGAGKRDHICTADGLIRCQKNLDFTLLFQMPCATGVQRKMIQLNSSCSLFGHSWNIRNLGNKKGGRSRIV
jgi:hypothetical protein